MKNISIILGLIILLIINNGVVFSQEIISDWNEGNIINGTDDRFEPIGGLGAIVCNTEKFSGSCQMLYGLTQCGINTRYNLPNMNVKHTLKFRYMSSTQVVIAVLFRPDCGYIITTLPPTTNSAKSVTVNYTCQVQLKIMMWTVYKSANNPSWFILDDFSTDIILDNQPDIIINDGDFMQTLKPFSDDDMIITPVKTETKRIEVYEHNNIKGWKNGINSL